MWRYTENLIVALSVALGGILLFTAVFLLYRYYINQRLKGKFAKIPLPRIWVVALAFLILITGSLSGYFISGAWTASTHKQYARIGALRTQTAQYVPEIETLAKAMTVDFDINPAGVAGYAGFENVTTGISLNNYAALVDMLGQLENPYKSVFTILQMKEEMKFVFEGVDVFDKWVKLKNDRFPLLSPYNLSSEYFVSYSETTQHLRVIRKSRFEPFVYDRAKNDIQKITQDIIYKMDYSVQGGDEVVECEIFSVLHAFGKDYIRQYQYLKNVKDKSFTKYIISPKTVLQYPGGGGNAVFEIDSDNPYGTECHFYQVDYAAGGDKVMLFVNQVFASAYNGMPNMTWIKLYANSGAEFVLYNTVFSSDAAFYNTPQVKSEVFYSDTSKDLIKMYAAQDKNRTLSKGVPVNYNAAYKKLPISWQTREILYADKTDTIVFNNFGGVDTDSPKTDDQVISNAAFGYLLKGIWSLAQNTGAIINSVTKPSLREKNADFEIALQDRLGAVSQNVVNTSYLAKNHNLIINKSKSYIII